MMSLVSPLVNAICWSVILERLDSLQSKRLIPLISSAATVGAICAGWIAAEVIEIGGLAALITLISITLILLATLPRAILGERKPVPQNNKQVKQRVSLWSGLGQLKPLMKTPLLAVTMVATLLMAISTNLVDFLFKAEVQQHIPVAEIGPFLARFHAITNLLIFLLQIFILNKLTHRLGLKGSYSLYPSSLLAVGALCLFPINWLAVVFLRGVDTLMKFTVYSNTENLVLTPVSFVVRTQVKVLLKGAIYPLGGLIAGVIIAVITYLSDDTAVKIQATLVLTLLLSLLWIYLTRQAHQHYICQLATNLELPTKTKLFNDESLTAIRKFKSLKVHDLNSETLYQLFTGLSLSLGIDKQKLRYIWQDQKARAELIEWLDNLARLSAINGLGQKLEVLSELPLNELNSAE